MTRLPQRMRLVPLVVLLLGLSGCFNPFDPRIATTIGVYVPPPEPNTPQGVIRLFEWCWNNRDIALYKEIFTADFRFEFSLGDSAGNTFREHPVDRETELTIAQNLFVGGGAEPPASSIVLHLDPTLRPLSDSRPGKNPKWHKEIVTSVDLTINTEAQEFRIMGNARFFVVRGDSALIPKELGFKPDTTRWYIDQWNDETLTGLGGAVAPGDMAARVSRGAVAPVRRTGPRSLEPPWDISWGGLKALYSR